MAQLHSTLVRIQRLPELARPRKGANDPCYQPALDAQHETYAIMKDAKEDGILASAIALFGETLPSIARVNPWATHLMLFPTFDATAHSYKLRTKLVQSYGDALEVIAASSPHNALQTLRFLFSESDKNSLGFKHYGHLFNRSVSSLPAVASGYCGQTNAYGLGELLLTRAITPSQRKALCLAFETSVGMMRKQLEADPNIPTTDPKALADLLHTIDPPDPNYVPVHDPDDVITPIMARGLGPAAVYLGALQLLDQIKAEKGRTFPQPPGHS